MAMLLTRTDSYPRRATVAGSCTTSFNITSIESRRTQLKHYRKTNNRYRILQL